MHFPIKFFSCILLMSMVFSGAELFAQSKRGAKRVKAEATRERFITREAKVSGRDKKDINFDDVQIGGNRKTPMSSLITKSNSNKDHDFIKIRLRWHPEMVQSASSLDYGSTAR